MHNMVSHIFFCLPHILQIKPSELCLMTFSIPHSVPRFLISLGRSFPIQQQLHLSETWLVLCTLLRAAHEWCTCFAVSSRHELNPYWPLHWQLVLRSLGRVHLPVITTLILGGDDPVLKALASYQCCLGSIPRPSFICGLSLLVPTLACTVRFFLWVLQFFSLHKNKHFQIPNQSGIQIPQTVQRGTLVQSIKSIYLFI